MSTMDSFCGKSLKELLLLLLLSFSISGMTQVVSPSHRDLSDTLRADTLSYLASHYSDIGNYFEPIRLETEALSIWERLLGKAYPSYAASLSNLAYYYCDVGNYAEAIKRGTEVVDILEQARGKNHPDYATSLNNLAEYYGHNGEYFEAIKCERKALDIWEKLRGKEHSDYAMSLSNLAKYYYNIGSIYEAIRLEREALAIRERSLGQEHIDYATSQNNLAEYYYYLGDYAKAIECGVEAMKIYERSLGENHPKYAMALSNFARFYYHIDNDSEAIRIGKYALKLQERSLGKDHPSYATSLSNLSYYYSAVGDYLKAIELGREALAIEERSLGREHPNYAISLSSLANHLYLYINHSADKDSLASLIACTTQATRLRANYVCKMFANLTSRERNLYWQKHQNWFSNTILQYAYKFPTDSLIVNAYDGTLLSKGLLLNSEIEMSRLLRESGDKEAVEAYQELLQSRHLLDKLYLKPVAERNVNTDSLRKVISRMERRLLRRSKTYGDYTRNLSINWQDVQRQLGKKDVAIEFASFPYIEDTTTTYVALVLDSKMKTPQMIPLFEEHQLPAKVGPKHYTTSEVGRLVWGKLLKYLKKADNVYFAPAGELYNIAIESLPDLEDSTKRMSDRWNFYRLSSTRELAVAKTKSKRTREAVLYGGLQYALDTKLLEEDSRKYQTTERRDWTSSGIADSLGLRGGVAYLPGTKVEVENISSSLKEASIRPSLFVDSIGTEASFKDLSGRRTSLLHLATHGFYWTREEAQMKDVAFLPQDERSSLRNTEEKALNRSGLLFSGANYALKGEELPEDVDDGILTAKEISILDLRGLDLVVLSACQTGLGEITADGVFGLQRGFKKAGAKTILMSLWNVPDTPTRLLMTRFYDNLLLNKNPRTGKAFTKFEALKDAQRYVREYEEDNGISYRDPKNWAAFVLLDAMEK